MEQVMKEAQGQGGVVSTSLFEDVLDLSGLGL